jgi:hypothetical protein
MLGIFQRDIFTEIALLVDVNDIVRFSRTSKTFYKFFQEPYFWSLKYKGDFGERLPLEASLALTTRQSYIQRYTLEGGVTFGSQLFQSVSTLTSRAIKSKNLLLIDFYLDLLEKVLQKARVRKKPYLIDWFSLIKDSLNLPTRHVFDRIISLGEKYNSSSNSLIQGLAYATGRGLIDDNYIARISHTFCIDEYEFLVTAAKEVELEGALDKGDYSQVLEYNTNPYFVVEELLKRGQEELAKEYIHKGGHFQDHLLLGKIKAGFKIKEEDIPNTAVPNLLILAMLSANNLNLDFLQKQHLDANLYFPSIPPVPALIRLLHNKGYPIENIIRGLLSSRGEACIIEEISTILGRDVGEEIIKKGSPSLSLILDAFLKDRYNPRKVARWALKSGLRGIWFSLHRKHGFSEFSVYMDPDIDLFVDLAQRESEKSFINIYREVFT